MASQIRSASYSLPAVALAALLALHPAGTWAQTAALPSGQSIIPANLRTIQAPGTPPTTPGTAATSLMGTMTPGPSNTTSSTSTTNPAGYNSGLYGCATNVQTSMATTANYQYVQQYANHLAIRQQPKSFSSCIKGIIQQASSFNPFKTYGNSTGGINWGALFASVGDSLMKTLVSDLESAVCAEAQAAASGIFGTINHDITQITGTNAGIVIQLQTGSGSASLGFTTPSIAQLLQSSSTTTSTSTDTDNGDDTNYGTDDDTTGDNTGDIPDEMTGSTGDSTGVSGSTTGSSGAAPVTSPTSGATNPTNPSGCAGPLMSDGSCGDSNDEP